MSDRPIGVFDSGVGGLSVVNAIFRLLEQEAVYYVADSANCPYGGRNSEEIARLSLGIGRYLVQEGAKAIVVACNTASAASLEVLRETFPEIPIVGMVPAVKPAALVSRSGIVGVLATAATLRGSLYGQVVQRHAAGRVRVIANACEGLVERVEEGDTDGPETVALLSRCLDPLLKAGADVIVLGCTHYVFLASTIRRLAPPGVAVIESSEAVALQTSRVLRLHGLLRTTGTPPQHTFATSGDAVAFRLTLARLLSLHVEPLALQWEGDRLLSRTL